MIMSTIRSFAKADAPQKPKINRQPVSISFENHEASRRLVTAAAKRVIAQHKDELQALAYK
jgi:hypothetical protein